ncbi:hypothetical protein [Uliginosibacterium gangwonense]|uniref:hypothetical protein n=1 Tax=Uliginosibacterium gangwonense TaxID=392736 RepID=UPI0003638DEC|nr:hypothetical protein [Uliginosibacterium gangwonense]
MEIKVTHTLTLSEETKFFLKELFGKVPSSSTSSWPFPERPEESPASQAPKERLNTTPEGTATTRIGAETKASILKALPATLDVVAKSVKRQPLIVQDLLKLLWERGEVKFDGTEYYREGD